MSVDAKERPLYQIIVDDLLEQIKAQHYQPGDRIPTELELSETYQVSRITAIRAVKELEQRGIVYRQKARGTFVNEPQYWQRAEGERQPEAASQPAAPAPALPILSVIMPFAQEFGYDILRGVEQAAHRLGYYVTFHDTQNDPERERDILQQLRTDGIGGIVLYPCQSFSNITEISSMIIEKFPFVVIDRDMPGLNISRIESDNYQGSYNATRHLIELGHRRIAFLVQEMKEIVPAQQRYRGYCQALVDAGIPLRREWLLDTREQFPYILDSDPEYRAKLDRAIIAHWWESGLEPPTAVVAQNDISALFLMKSAIEHKIRIPEQLSLTGFDNLSFAQHLDVPLTTVEQSFHTMGEKAVELLIQQIQTGEFTPRQLTLETRLIVRESTAPPGAE